MMRISKRWIFRLIGFIMLTLIIGWFIMLIMTERYVYDEPKKIRTAEMSLLSTEHFLRAYYEENSRYPTTMQELNIFISRQKFGEPLLQDPWEHPYIYKSNGKEYRLLSKGPDRMLGTDDDIDSKEM